jgi:hypothetical protein
LKTRTFWPVASVTSARSVSLDNVRVSANARTCRPLILPTEKMLANTLGDHLREHGVLWHVIQFYVTGAAMRQVLPARGIDYTPYMYSTGLFDRAWKPI